MIKTFLLLLVVVPLMMFFMIALAVNTTSTTTTTATTTTATGQNGFSLHHFTKHYSTTFCVGLTLENNSLTK
jgi:hypothetical protein